mgnify:CR=1 FL=1
MRKTLFGIVAVCGLLAIGLASNVMANGKLAGGDADIIMVSPQMIVLAKVASVTVHTKIPYNLVDTGTIDEPNTVELNGVVASSTWADDCGDLVARFDVADLALTADKDVTLTLTGSFKAGGTFTAIDVVSVK